LGETKKRVFVWPLVGFGIGKKGKLERKGTEMKV